MVRSLVFQLYATSPVALDLLYSSCHSGRSQPRLEALCETFQHMLLQAGDVFVVLDALDECPTRQQYPDGRLLDWISGQLKFAENVHILTTSRPEQDIQSSITKWARDSDIVSLQQGLIDEDIHQYIQTRVRTDKGLSRWQQQPEIQEEIITALMGKADGMYELPMLGYPLANKFI